MRNRYLYYGYQSALQKEVCNNYIDWGENQIKEDKINNIDTTAMTLAGKDEMQRKGQVAFLQKQEMYDTALSYIKDANENAGWKYEISSTEALQFTVYNEGDFCDWHSDGGSDHFSTYKKLIGEPVQDGSKYAESDMMVDKIRKLTLTINLSDGYNDYDGGDLYIKDNDGNEKLVEGFRNQGSVVVFPSYTQHRVSTVTKGTRYSMVLWCLGYPFK